MNTRAKKPARGTALTRFLLPITPWREPRGARGAAVMEAVTKAGLALLAEKVSREVTVVEIAKRAGLARASLLLQFPDGIPDVLSAIVNHEYERILETEESLWSAMPPTSPLEAVHRLMEAIHLRAKATGHLYANLLSEEMQSAGGHRGHIRGTFGLLGVMIAARAMADIPEEEAVMHATSMALGEVLARSVWSASATDWGASNLMSYKSDSSPSALWLSHVLAESLLPRMREDARRVPETAAGPIRPKTRKSMPRQGARR